MVRLRTDSQPMQKKIAFSCFVDAKPKFEKEVVRWFWSLRQKLKVPASDIFITCAPGISTELKDWLESQSGLNLYYEECFTEVSRPANKWLQLKALNTDASGDYTHVVVSDCDKIFLEFSGGWCDDSVRACKFIPRPTFEIFRDIFKLYFETEPRFTIERADQQDPNLDKRSYVNNHNGGLIIFPLERLPLLSDRWKHWIDELMARPKLLQRNIRNLDQVALSLVMHEIESDINFLPQTFDLGPNISSVSPHVLAEGSGQLVLHVHGYDDELGQVICGDKAPDNFRQYVQNINTEYVEWSSSIKLAA